MTQTFLFEGSFLPLVRRTQGPVYDEYSKARIKLSNMVDSQPNPERKFQGKLNLRLIFKLPFPDGIGAKRKEELEDKYYTNRPTLGTLLKVVEELLSGVLINDGSMIVSVMAEKRMSKAPGVELVITEIE